MRTLTANKADYSSREEHTRSQPHHHAFHPSVPVSPQPCCLAAAASWHVSRQGSTHVGTWWHRLDSLGPPSRGHGSSAVPRSAKQILRSACVRYRACAVDMQAHRTIVTRARAHDCSGNLMRKMTEIRGEPRGWVVHWPEGMCRRRPNTPRKKEEKKKKKKKKKSAVSLSNPQSSC